MSAISSSLELGGDERRATTSASKSRPPCCPCQLPKEGCCLMRRQASGMLSIVGARLIVDKLCEEGSCRDKECTWPMARVSAALDPPLSLEMLQRRGRVDASSFLANSTCVPSRNLLSVGACEDAASFTNVNLRRSGKALPVSRMTGPWCIALLPFCWR